MSASHRPQAARVRLASRRHVLGAVAGAAAGAANPEEAVVRVEGLQKSFGSNVVLRSIDLIENPEPIAQHVAGVKRILSLNLVQHDKARSLFRRNKIDQLKYPELLAMLKRVKNEEFRNKLTGMFNAVVLYAMDSDSPKSNRS